jgi:hypothetical protein
MWTKSKAGFLAAALSATLPILMCGRAEAGVEKMFDDRMRGGIVYGSAAGYSDDGCEYTYININGQEERGAHTNITSIMFYKVDLCNNTVTSIPGGSTAYEEGILVAPDSKLLYAELSDWMQFAVEHCDYPSGEKLCTPGEARLTARWIGGFENIYQGHGNFHERVGPTNLSDKFAYITQSRYNGAERIADFEFQLEIDGVPIYFSGGYNSYGTLRYVKSGSFTMYRITP